GPKVALAPYRSVALLQFTRSNARLLALSSQGLVTFRAPAWAGRGDVQSYPGTSGPSARTGRAVARGEHVMAYVATGTAGNDTLNQAGDTGPGTIVGLAGDDSSFTGSGLATVTGDSGNDTVVLRAGNTGTISAGSENDSIFANGGIGAMQLLGNAGNDTIDFTAATSGVTVVGGDDSADGNDSIV